MFMSVFTLSEIRRFRVEVVSAKEKLLQYPLVGYKNF